MKTLSPCPFCGGDPELKDHRILWAVECRSCGATVIGERAEEPTGDEPPEFWEQIENSAIEKWNLRKT